MGIILSNDLGNINEVVITIHTPNLRESTTTIATKHLQRQLLHQSVGSLDFRRCSNLPSPTLSAFAVQKKSYLQSQFQF